MIFGAIRQYRLASWWARGLLLTMIGLAYPIYHLYDQTFVKQWQLNALHKSIDGSQSRYSTMIEKVSGIDALKQNIAGLEAEFAMAQDVLPEKLNIEKKLHDVARIARKSGVTMAEFQPVDGHEINNTGKFGVRRIQLAVVGAYAEIVAMMDDLVHLNYPVQIENIVFKGAVKGGAALRQFEEGELDLWRSVESNSVTHAVMTLIYFQTMDTTKKDSIASNATKDQEKAIR